MWIEDSDPEPRPRDVVESLLLIVIPVVSALVALTLLVYFLA
jgi:hypothetical protein